MDALLPTRGARGFLQGAMDGIVHHVLSLAASRAHCDGRAVVDDADIRVALRAALPGSPVSPSAAALSSLTDLPALDPVVQCCVDADHVALLALVRSPPTAGLGPCLLHRVLLGRFSAEIMDSLVTAVLALDAVDLLERDSGGRTAAMTAAFLGHAAVLPRLLSDSPECLNDIRDNDQRTVLHWAAFSGRDCCRILLDRGADPSVTDEAGKTPVVCAIESPHLDDLSCKVTVALLLYHGASTDDALHTAVRCGRVETTDLLLECGCPANVRDARQRTLFHKAVAWEDFLEDDEDEDEEGEGEEEEEEEEEDEDEDEDVEDIDPEEDDAIDDDDYASSTASSSPPGSDQALLLIQTLSSFDIDVDAADDQGQTALHLACQQFASAIVEALLGLGADPNVRDHHGRTPLHHLIVARPYDQDAWQLLVDAGADVSLADNDGRTLLHHLPLAHHIAPEPEPEPAPSRGHSRNNSRESVASIPDGYSPDIVEPDALAVKRGIQFLLSAGASPTASDAQGLTPMHEVLRYVGARDRYRCLRVLYHAGGRLSTADSIGMTPVHYCLRHFGDTRHDFAALFDLSLPVEHRDSRGQSLLMLAVGYADLSTVAVILEAGAADVDAADARGRTPLHLAVAAVAERDGVSKAKHLIDHGASVNAQTNQGRTPLHELVAVLDPPLDLAVHLVRRGADVNLCDNAGRSPLHLCAEHGKPRDLVKLLVDNGADPGLVDLHGQMPLHTAFAQDQPDLAEFLAGLGAPITAKDKDDNTILHLAALSDAHAPLCATLLSANPALRDVVNDRNYFGETALFLAARAGCPEMVAALLREGSADIFCPGPDGATALEAAPSDESEVLHELMSALSARFVLPSFTGTVNVRPLVRLADSLDSARHRLEWLPTLDDLIADLRQVPARDRAPGVDRLHDTIHSFDGAVRGLRRAAVAMLASRPTGANLEALRASVRESAAQLAEIATERLAHAVAVRTAGQDQLSTLDEHLAALPKTLARTAAATETAPSLSATIDSFVQWKATLCLRFQQLHAEGRVRQTRSVDATIKDLGDALAEERELLADVIPDGLRHARAVVARARAHCASVRAHAAEARGQEQRLQSIQVFYHTVANEMVRIDGEAADDVPRIVSGIVAHRVDYVEQRKRLINMRAELELRALECPGDPQSAARSKLQAQEAKVAELTQQHMGRWSRLAAFAVAQTPIGSIMVPDHPYLFLDGTINTELKHHLGDSDRIRGLPGVLRFVEQYAGIFGQASARQLAPRLICGPMQVHRRFADYESVEALSRRVHRASFEGNPCVLKEYSIGKEEVRRAFEREVRVLYRIQHPAIARLEAYFYDGNTAYVQLPHYPGGTLRAWLDAEPRSELDMMAMFQRLVRGVAVLHDKHILHGNLKFQNVLINDVNQPVICDFDDSREDDSLLADARAGGRLRAASSAAQYLAPEVLEDRSRGPSMAADMWAIGTMLYVAHFPREAHPSTLSFSGASDSLPIPRHTNSDLVDILRRLLHRDPARRPLAPAALDHPYFNPFDYLRETKALWGSSDKREMLRRHLDGIRKQRLAEGRNTVLEIDRDKMTDQVIYGFGELKEHELLNPIRVSFKGESGIDMVHVQAGGLTADLYTTFWEQLINRTEPPRLFESAPESEAPPVPTVMPRAGFLRDPWAYEMVGRVLVKCLIDGVAIPVSFPSAMYRWLLGEDDGFHLDHLEEFNWQMARSLREMLVTDNVEDIIPYTFEGLVPNGQDRDVCDGNKHEFVQLKVHDILIKSRTDQMHALRVGFRCVPEVTEMISSFNPMELEMLIAGDSYLDADMILNNLVFSPPEADPRWGEYTTTVSPPQAKGGKRRKSGGASSVVSSAGSSVGSAAESEVVSSTPQDVRRVVGEMSREALRRFLRFATGKVRFPAGGISPPIKILYVPFSSFQQPAEMRLNEYPVGHTCFHSIALPDYRDVGLLRERLLEAISSSDFGVE